MFYFMLVYCHLSRSNNVQANYVCKYRLYCKIKRNYKNSIISNHFFYVSEGSTDHLEKLCCISAHLCGDPVLRSPHSVHTAVCCLPCFPAQLDLNVLFYITFTV